MLSRLFDEKKYKPLEYILRGYRENRVINTLEKRQQPRFQSEIQKNLVDQPK